MLFFSNQSLFLLAEVDKHKTCPICPRSQIVFSDLKIDEMNLKKPVNIVELLFCIP